MPPAIPAIVPRPDNPGRLVALADRCVQCGLCLPACPTYVRDRVEAQSPRGRIALARAWATASIETTAVGDAHLDHCLGCRSCEAVCPAGVEYGALLVLARAQQRERRGTHWRQRALEMLAARPRWLTTALHLYAAVYPWLPSRLRPLPRPPTLSRVEYAPARAEPAGLVEQSTVAVFVGCVAGAFETELRVALARLCAAAGIATTAPAGQTCCGALHAHAGNTMAARQLAARNVKALARSGTVLTLASGCHDAVAQALAGHAVTHDAMEFLDAHGGHLQFRAMPERVALHLPCTQRSVARSVPALRRLLAKVPQLQVIELDAGYGCCGAAGTTMLTDPLRAADYRRPLLDQFQASGATRLLSANIGCRLHLGNAISRPVQHPLEYLAALLVEEP